MRRLLEILFLMGVIAAGVVSAQQGTPPGAYGPASGATNAAGSITASLATNVTYATDPAYGVNVQNEFLGSDLTWSNAQGPVAVASTASDFPFTAAMNGLDCWGLSAGSVTIPVGTFTFTDATHGTCSSTSTNSAAGNGTFTVLNNNNAAMHAAGTAFAAKCGTFEMPAGYIEITATDITPAEPAKCQLTPSFASGWHIKGQGHMATWIIPRPGTTYVSTGGACFFSGSLNTQLDNFSIQGLGQSLAGISTNCSTLLYVAQASHLSDVGVFSIGSAATNTPRPLNIGSQGGVAFNFYADFGPQGGIACGGPDAAIEHSYNSDITGGIALEVVAGGICYSRGNRWDCGSTAIQVDTNGFLDSIDDYSGNLGSCVFLRMNGNPSSAKLINYENGFVTSACATCYGIYGGAANWKVSAIGSTIPGSTTNGYLNGANAGTFTDLGDNTFFGNVITPANLTLHGPGSVQAQVIGNIATSACGTSTNGSLAAGSTNLHGQFTVTYAGAPGASCVETITFPTNSFAVAPLCNAIDVGGTNALANRIVNGTITATSFPFTMNSTAFTNGNTDIIQYNCTYP